MANSIRMYPNGMPHLPIQVRRRMVLELTCLGILTLIYLALMPSRHMGMDVALALTALGLVGLSSNYTRENVWGSPPAADFDRIRRCTTSMTLFTIPPIILFAGIGTWMCMHEGGAWSDVGYRLFRVNFFLTLLIYLPWALIQQTLFQYYLLGRLRGILPFASPFLISVINGILYGAVHLPSWEVTIVTVLGGIMWSYSYHKDRFTLPIAISHALLGTTFYYWVLDRDLIVQNLEIYAGH